VVGGCGSIKSFQVASGAKATEATVVTCGGGGWWVMVEVRDGWVDELAVSKQKNSA